MGVQNSLATGLIQLDRWAWNGSITAIHTAIIGLWFQNCMTAFTFIEELASIGRHGFFFLMTTGWTGNQRL